MAADGLDVEISVVSTDNRELLALCLGSLPEACTGVRWHATVVDNASTDGSGELVAREFEWATLERNAVRRDFAANHNRVLADVIATGAARYVVVIHEDVELEPNAVSELVAFCDGRPALGAAGPLVFGPDGVRHVSWQSFPRPAGEVWSALVPGRGRPAPRGDAGWLDGPCTLLRTAALQAVGPFDETFFIFFEDVDLCLRLLNAGWASAVCETARIVHRRHGSTGDPSVASAIELQMLRSRYLYFRKHSGPRRAHAVSSLIRGTLALRSMKAFVAERAHARMLWSLARYDPQRPSPLESGATR